MKTYTNGKPIPIRCPICGDSMAKLALGGEHACTKCDGQICEACCDKGIRPLKVEDLTPSVLDLTDDSDVGG